MHQTTDGNFDDCYSSMQGILWMVTIILYFIVSFAFDNWHISWIIYLIAAAATCFINMMFQLKNQ